MTEENYKYRTSPFLLRNQFSGKGKYHIPIIPKFQAAEDDFSDLRLIGFDKTKLENNNHLDRMVHFFLYDYKFERVWKSPDTDLEKLKRYRAVLSPDFSMYIEMAPVMQLYNTFRNRWCGAYYASKGIRVVPTVSWGNENTFDFCFDGIEKGSVVAVSTYMVSEHGNHKDQKEFFLKGYNELLHRIAPEKIICYNEPFPEMQGDIVFVDYDLSSWRYMNDDPAAYTPSKYINYICGLEPLPENADIIVKSGYVPTADFYSKGMGSANGGDWQPSPNKPEDKRFLGKPGDINEYVKPNGERISTKIGADGRAVKERHWTDHRRPDKHSSPHDHIVNWLSPPEKGPDPGPSINYYDGNVPEFKDFKELTQKMGEIVFLPPDTNYNFESISDFKDCMERHGEVEFLYNGRSYSITHLEDLIDIGEGYYKKDDIRYNAANHEECIDWMGKQYHTADEVLEYRMDGVRLRDIITKVKVLFRTI